MKSQKVAITHLAIEMDFQVTHHATAMKRVAAQHVLTKCSTCNTFQVTSDLLNSENLKIAIAQLCIELLVCNFIMLSLTQR